MCSPMTATPRGVCTTSTTPERLRRGSVEDVTVAPNFGGWIMTAVSIPGSFTSLVN